MAPVALGHFGPVDGWRAPVAGLDLSPAVTLALNTAYGVDLAPEAVMAPPAEYHVGGVPRDDRLGVGLGYGGRAGVAAVQQELDRCFTAGGQIAGEGRRNDEHELDPSRTELCCCVAGAIEILHDGEVSRGFERVQQEATLRSVALV